MQNIGFQLYTVIDLLTDEKTTKSVLRDIKDLGYSSVQLCGNIDEIENFGRICHELNFPIIGVLTDINCCEQHKNELFSICCKYTIPDISISSPTKTLEETQDMIKRVNAFAKEAHKNGFTFSYHNHGHEFIKVWENKTVMELFIEGFDSETVDFMPDTYWIQNGGVDIRHLLEKLRGRVKILHLKDMKRIPEGQTFAEIGHGNLYFEGIIETALNCGVKHFVVEQDECDGNPVDSLKKSIEYLNSIKEA